MKILIVISSLASGGAERVTSNLANAWSKRGWDITLVTFASANLDFYPLDGSIHRIPLDLAKDSINFGQALWANLRRLLALRRILKDRQPDFVLGMMVTGSVLITLASIGLSCYVFVSERIHPPRLPLGKVWSLLRRYTYPLANRVIALANESSLWLQIHAPGSRVVVIPNPVLFPLPLVEPFLYPFQIISNETKLLLAVGRLAEQKGFNYLIKSFAVLARKYADWNLVILGEGPKRNELEALIKALGLNDCIKLPGRAGNVANWYQRADLYVMSSLFEGFPNTLIEAMAHGCPAVSFDCDTGPRDIIHHKIDGLLVSVGDVEALTESLDYLMGNLELRIQYGTQAAKIRERFSLERILSLWDHLFDEVTGESKI